MPPFPARLVRAAEARARFGPRVDRLGHFLTVGDPLADDVSHALAPLAAAERERLVSQALRLERLETLPAPLRRYAETLAALPVWADPERCARGGVAVLRKGVLASAVLTYRSLIGGYCSPAGNKPLAFSGRLQYAAARRLAETGRFVQHLYAKDGVLPARPGWVAVARVRLMHAQVRRLLSADPRFDQAAWGLPINQADLAATALLFSRELIAGLRRLGLTVPRVEADDVLHLWRVVGWLMGVDPELLCADEPEADRLWAIIQATQGPPDADSVALTKALVESPLSTARTPAQRRRAEALVPLAWGFSRYLLGDEVADGLRHPKTPWRFTGAALRPVLSVTDGVFERLPGHERVSLAVGGRYWARAVASRLGGEDARFTVPDAVRHPH